MAGPAPFSVGRQPSWRRRPALLVILEAAELTLALLGPRLAGLAILAFLMPFTAGAPSPAGAGGPSADPGRLSP